MTYRDTISLRRAHFRSVLSRINICGTGAVAIPLSSRDARAARSCLVLTFRAGNFWRRWRICDHLAALHLTPACPNIAGVGGSIERSTRAREGYGWLSGWSRSRYHRIYPACCTPSAGLPSQITATYVATAHNRDHSEHPLHFVEEWVAGAKYLSAERTSQRLRQTKNAFFGRGWAVLPDVAATLRNARQRGSLRRAAPLGVSTHSHFITWLICFQQ